MKTILVILIFLAVLSLAFLWFVGMFDAIEIREKENDEYAVAGKEFVGPYSKVGAVFSQVDQALRKINVESSMGLGIYKDDPKTTAKDSLRSFVGNVLKASDMGRTSEIEDLGLSVLTIERKPAMVVTLKARSSLTYMFGPLRVYPAMSKYALEKDYHPSHSFEVYDMANKKVHYIMQL